jgi:hypothetical protein
MMMVVVAAKKSNEIFSHFGVRTLADAFFFTFKTARR